MKIRMLRSETGVLHGGTYHYLGGVEYEVPREVPQELANAWVGSIAVLVDADPALPPGYTITQKRGGYYEVKDPQGVVIEGPSNRKWQGQDGAAQGAWAHFNQQGE